MILYNITVKVDAEIHEEWLDWMFKTHIPEMMATGTFLDYRVCKLLHEEEDGKTYAVQYFSTDLDTLLSYQRNHARHLQEAHANRFPGRYVAFRTVMEILQPPQIT